MKSLPFLSQTLAVLIAGTALAAPAFSAETAPKGGQASAPAATGQLTAVNDKTDAAWLAKARKEYPAETCVVSGEKLGGMGAPRDFVYKQAGQPDRLVRFCCPDCVSDFSKEPAKYLKLIDAAAAKAGSGASSGH